MVKENSWIGWTVKIDGQDATLDAGPWLAVQVPAGVHTVEFRHRPWDVPLGLVLCFAGLFLTIYILERGG